VTRLYELTSAYAQLADRALDGDEIDDDQLAQLGDELKVKTASLVHVMRELDLDVVRYDAELERLTKRRKAAAGNRDRLRRYVQQCMEQANVQRLKADTLSIALQDCPERVEVDDAARVPPEYMRTKTEVAVAKADVLAHYRATGEIVPGVRIERARRLVIK
jgi:hypothetical protein